MSSSCYNSSIQPDLSCRQRVHLPLCAGSCVCFWLSLTSVCMLRTRQVLLSFLELFGLSIFYPEKQRVGELKETSELPLISPEPEANPGQPFPFLLPWLSLPRAFRYMLRAPSSRLPIKERVSRAYTSQSHGTCSLVCPPLFPWFQTKNEPFSLLCFSDDSTLSFQHIWLFFVVVIFLFLFVVFGIKNLTHNGQMLHHLPSKSSVLILCF